MLKQLRETVIVFSLIGLAQGCQPVDPNAAGTTPATTGTQPTPAAAVQADSTHDAQVVGTWANPEAGMTFRLEANGGYMMQLQGNQMAGTWSTPQPGVLVFAVNGTTTNYQYQVQPGGLGLQDPQGNAMWFARAGAQGGQGGNVASAPAPTPPTGKFSYPRRYQKYNAPVLAYLAETLSKQNPQSVALGLRRLSSVAQTFLNTSQAFAEQLHYFGCQADPSLMLFDWPSARMAGRAPQNCAATGQSWQSTYSLSNGTVTPANCDQCSREAFMSVLAFRCTVGLMSKQECNTTMQQLSNQANASHETSLRIIEAMGGNNCVCGDPDCSC